MPVNRVLTAMTVLALLAGCVDVATTVATDGQKTYTIDCDMESQRCFDRAADLCPGGYYLVGRKNGTTELPHTGGVVATPHTQLTVECKAP